MDAARPSLVVTRKLPDAVEERLRRDYVSTLNGDDRALSDDELVERAREADAIITCPTDSFSRRIIERLPERMRAIATFSVGYDHIDLAAARERGITVTNTPDVLTESTADTAMLCLLGAARRAFEGEAMVRTDRWDGWAPTQLLGLELNGSRLGIVGLGRIGQALARRARAFGMEVHYHDPVRAPAEREQGAIYHEDLDEMLPEVRFLSLHCPMSAENRHMIDDRTLDLLPRGAVLVNTARGPLIDDEAVLRALDDGRLFAAGLDVFEGEPKLHDGYRTRRNCFLLPHLGSATIETRNAMGFRCLDNLDAIFRGDAAPDALT
jgi:lactate dehydrogenase-like 2-hydroxyacid dehydrogenase